MSVALLVTCYARGQSGEWTWVGGNVAIAQPGVYGTKGVPAPGNIPGSRAYAASATDSSGNFWLFGGDGASGNAAALTYNDLWEFSPTTKEWTWWSGDNAKSPGVYGTLGVPAPNNVPGAREAPVVWTDPNGNVWLFGGAGYDSGGTIGYLNDFWKFDSTTHEWAWMGGSNTSLASGIRCLPGIYGEQGVASSDNLPGGRESGIGWTDSSGNLWLFAGAGCDSNATGGSLNDLWKFNPATGDWTWISGSNSGSNDGKYGTLGTASVSNTPGGRVSPANLGADASGNFWLFGGVGYDASGTYGNLNDLWEFNPATAQWTWQSGSSSLPPASSAITGSQPGVYGELGQYAATNVPGGRYGSVGSIDGKGNLRLFGGQVLSSPQNMFNDLWEFDPVSKEWAWIGGSDTLSCLIKNTDGSCGANGAPASYGSLGVPAASNVPGSRFEDVSWTDKSGNLWIFGGGGIASFPNFAPLGDLWEFETAVASTTPVFGTMTFSPASTVAVGTSDTITISDTLTYSGAQPTGAVTYVLDGVSYTATCTTSGSPETCSAQVRAGAIASLPVASYTVTGSIGADSNYSAASATSGTFTVNAAVTGCTVPAPTSNTMNIAYFTLAESDLDGGTFPNGISSNYVLPALGVNGFPVYNTAATATSGGIAPPKDLLADGEITWWTPTLNNGGPNGTSDVIATGAGVVSLPFSNNLFFPPNGTGADDAHGFQTAVLTGNLVAPAPETVSFTLGSDDMAFLYLDGQIACDDGGVHAPTSVPCTSSTIAAGPHTLQLFYADLNQSGAALDFTVTTSNVGVGAGDQFVFGTMTFSPTATEPHGTNQAITIGDTVTYSGAPPTGAVSFSLNGVSYPATCTPPAANQETCSAVVPATTIAALPVAAYPVTGRFAGDCNYATAGAAAGTFTISPQQVVFGTMTVSPVATVQGTSLAITIGDTLSYSGPQPMGAVVYGLGTATYPATCSSASSSNGSPETCIATVPAPMIAALPAATYPVTGSFAGDPIYAAAAATSGTFTVTLPPPDFSIANVGPLTLVTQHHGRTTISVTPIDNFTGIVQLSCGPVPAYVTCEWGPATVDISGGMASTQLTIDTSGILNYLSTTSPSAPSQKSRTGWGAGRLMLAGLAFPAMLFFRRRRMAARLMIYGLVLLSMLQLSGCSNRYPDSTTPGTYSITILGTSGPIQHSAVLTLVVTQ